MSEERRPKLPVHIRKNSEVDNEIVNLRMCMGEEIEWFSDGDEFVVEFPLTPFEQKNFCRPPGGIGRLGANPAGCRDYQVFLQCP